MIGIFTNLPNVMTIMSDAWLMLIIFTLFDTTQLMGLAMLKAAGLQHYGAAITGTGYLLIGIPCSYYFCFVKEWGVRGLWVGPVLTAVYGSILSNIAISCINWPKVIDEIKERDQKENELRK